MDRELSLPEVIMHYIVEPPKADRASAHRVSRRGLFKESARASLVAAAS
jgi:hypothetical protein